MIDLNLDELRSAAGIGVAGNFAGHLEQAGEAADFARIAPTAGDAPKGIFPWHVPGVGGFLGTFPLSSDLLEEPGDDGPVNLQIEPEAGVLCRLAYDADGRVTDVVPVALGAFNDCSIRRPGASTISEKKNWGPHSKGVAERLFAVDDLDPDGALASLRLASALRRDGEARAYGIDSPLAGYSYAGRPLLDWLVDRLRAQRGAPGSPLEDVGAHLAQAGRPDMALIGIGATRYTPFGERSFLRPGDESIVVVYDSSASSPADVAAAIADAREDDLPSASVLRQAVAARA